MVLLNLLSVGRCKKKRPLGAFSEFVIMRNLNSFKLIMLTDDLAKKEYPLESQCDSFRLKARDEHQCKA